MSLNEDVRTDNKYDGRHAAIGDDILVNVAGYLYPGQITQVMNDPINAAYPWGVYEAQLSTGTLDPNTSLPAQFMPGPMQYDDATGGNSANLTANYWMFDPSKPLRPVKSSAVNGSSVGANTGGADVLTTTFVPDFDGTLEIVAMDRYSVSLAANSTFSIVVDDGTTTVTLDTDTKSLGLAGSGVANLRGQVACVAGVTYTIALHGVTSLGVATTAAGQGRIWATATSKV